MGALPDGFGDYGPLYEEAMAIVRRHRRARADDAPSDFGPFIACVDRFVQAYDPSLAVVMREWRATRTDETTDLPWIIVAETYLRPSGPAARTAPERSGR